MSKRLPSKEQDIRPRRTTIQRQCLCIRHPIPQSRAHRIEPNLRHRSQSQRQRSPAKPTRHRRSRLVKRVKSKNEAKARADISRVEISALDARGLGDVSNRRDTVSRVNEVTTRLLRDPVDKGRLSFPELEQLCSCRLWAPWCRPWKSAIRFQVDKRWYAPHIAGHCFIVARLVVEENGYSLRGFRHYYEKLGHYVKTLLSK